MHFDNAMLLGIGILVLDFLAWRFLNVQAERLRFGVRAVLFGVLSYVLSVSGMSPFSSAPWPDDTLRHLLALGLELLWWLQAAQLLNALLSRVILPRAWHSERLFQDVIRGLVFLAAALAAIAYVLELPLRGLLATSGAVAVILGLAIQSTLNDVFSGLVLNATQPFRLGDTVAIGDVEGQVVQSNWRATSLQNAQGNLVVIPNSVAAKANIVNYSQPSNTHGITVSLAIGPEVRPAKVLEALEQTALSVRDVLAYPKPIISLKRASEESIEYQIVCYVDTLGKMTSTRNALFDFAYRHLAARHIFLRSLSLRGAEAGGPPPPLGHLLRRVEMFQALSEEQMARLEAALTRLDFDAGAVIYSADTANSEESFSLNIVALGVCTLVLPHAGHEVEVRRMGPGDSIGQSGILSGIPSKVTMRALTPVVVLRLAKEPLGVLLQERPEIAIQMCRVLSQHYAREESLLAELPAESAHGEGLLHWLREGFQNLHLLGR
jgi:small-conductance mechanosensitive channel/CRP-like cAMP-binding protein